MPKRRCWLDIFTDPGSIYAPLLLLETLRDPQIETRVIYLRHRPKQCSKWEALGKVGRKSGYAYALTRSLALARLQLAQAWHARFRRTELEDQPCPALAAVAGHFSVPIKPVADCNAPEFLETLRQDPPDIILSAFYSQIFLREIIRVPRLGCINIHPSLLPQYRGTNPVYWAMVDDCRQAGITIHQIDEGLDTGGILTQADVPILPGDTHHQLYRKTVVAGATLLRQTLEKVLASGRIESESQPAGEWTVYPPPTKESFKMFRRLHKRFF
jgi:methionyl-tRNA formyltransferase